VDAWFTSPTFCQEVKNLGLHVIGRLTRDQTLYYRDGSGFTLEHLYRAHKHGWSRMRPWGWPFPRCR
jgi:hypothetical protein